MPARKTEPCPRGRWKEAISLLFCQLSVVEQRWQLERIERDVEAGKLRLDGLLIFRDGDRLLGAAMAMEQPGRSVLAWPPKTIAGLPADVAAEVSRELFSAVERFASERRARFVQSLLGREDRTMHPLLTSAGYHRLATLLYLKRDLRAGCSIAPLPNVEYHAYSPALHDDFLSVLEASYLHSLDCPELTGVRTSEDIFQSHRAQGEFREDHWLLARWNGRWAGCLLLVGLSELDAVEVAYVAVSPDARGRGLGRELTRRAIELAKETGAHWLTLAVDRRNRPARRLYEQLGFEPWDERDAYLLLLEPADRNWNRWSKVYS